MIRTLLNTSIHLYVCLNYKCHDFSEYDVIFFIVCTPKKYYNFTGNFRKIWDALKGEKTDTICYHVSKKFADIEISNKKIVIQNFAYFIVMFETLFCWVIGIF